jgi:signal transduction histidine kinase
VIDPKMSDRTEAAVVMVAARAGLAFAAGLVVATLVLLGFTWSKEVSALSASHAEDAVLAVAFLGYSLVGALIVARRPQNRVGWIFLASGLSFQLWIFSYWYATYGLVARPGSLPAAELMAWTSEWAVVPGFGLAFTFLLLVFPTGRLSSRKWRPVAWFAALAVSFAATTWATFPGPLSGFDQVTNPVGIAAVGRLDLPGLGWVLTVLAVVASAVSLIVRYIRSAGVERRQIQWFVYAATMAAMALTTLSIASESDWKPIAVAADVLFPLAVVALPTAVYIAIFKHDLYDLDIVISKTLTLGAVALGLGAAYVSVVAGAGWLLRSGGQTELGPQVAATALVAIAFQPVRRRAQQWANRAVYGQRATPYEVLARFSHRAAEASDGDLLARIPRLIVDGTGAVEATIWVRSDEGFRAAATWPESVERAGLPATDSFEDPDADYSLAVFHDGQLLGGLSLFKTRGEALPPAEEQLVANLASGMGLALRNVGLTSQLREQVAELEASRERILAAADEARRALEHDLDSGSQQQLVALKVMVGPTRKLAEQAGATRTAEVLARLEADAGEAIRAVREFSGGVYPPLLEAEGLATAITHQTQKAALPVDVEADGLDRYSREVEAAVYFTILEALQNIAKYAGASTVSVVLRQADGQLSFKVTDDGSGFDPSTVGAGSGLANMADRLDAVGATLSLESAPGSGTTVRSTVPIGDRAIY